MRKLASALVFRCPESEYITNRAFHMYTKNFVPHRRRYRLRDSGESLLHGVAMYQPLSRAAEPAAGG